MTPGTWAARQRRAARLLGAVLGVCSCVSTELEQSSPPPWACAEQVSSSEAEASVVLVRGRFGSIGSRFCSGVVIAPRLVVTALRCVVGLNDPLLSDPWLDASPGSAGVTSGSFDYESACRNELSWTPIEDGTFDSALGRVLAPDAVSVEVPSAPASDATDGIRPRITHLADDIITSRASSSCQESLAIIALQAPLDVRPAPIRIDETMQSGDLITLVGYCVTALSDLGAAAVAATVDSVTIDVSTPIAPPRAMTARGVLSMFAAGGGVFSAETGALVGVIASGEAPGCGQTTEGTTIGFRTAAFRDLFAAAARENGQTLRVEPSEARTVAECSSRAAW